MTEKERSYEEKAQELEAILQRLDDSDTPIDRLAEDVKRGVRLIKELDATLREVEHEVLDAFDGLKTLESGETAEEGERGEKQGSE